MRISRQRAYAASTSFFFWCATAGGSLYAPFTSRTREPLTASALASSSVRKSIACRTAPVPGCSLRSSARAASVESTVRWSSMSRVTVVPMAVAASTTGRTVPRAMSWPSRPSACPHAESFIETSAAGPSPSGARPSSRARYASRVRVASARLVMSSPRWSRVTCTRSVRRARTAARASSSVSPATNRSTTRRVAGLPVTARRSPGRRDAASRAFWVSTGPPTERDGNTSTLGSRRAPGPATHVRRHPVCFHTPVQGGVCAGRPAGTGGPRVRAARGAGDAGGRRLHAARLLRALTRAGNGRGRRRDGRRAHPLDLTRGSPPATRRWFEEFGIAAAEGPLRTPADPEAGILTRLVIPVRHAGRTHGYLWLLDDGRTDPDDLGDGALSAAVDLAAEAGRLLAGRSAAETALDRALRSGLDGTPAARDRAARTLADGLGAAAQVVVALAPAGALPPDWPVPGAGAVSAVLDGVGQALV